MNNALSSARIARAALGDAIVAIKSMQTDDTPRVESFGEREQRLMEGRSSPTGWPIKRVPIPDDCITIPRAPMCSPKQVGEIIDIVCDAAEKYARAQRKAKKAAENNK